jgi:DUF2934 family protein
MAKRTVPSSSSSTSQAGKQKQQPETLATNTNAFADQAADLGGPAGGDDKRATSMASEPSDEEIRRRAYTRYLDRGASDGHDFDDWLEAERELKGL